MTRSILVVPALAVALLAGPVAAEDAGPPAALVEAGAAALRPLLPAAGPRPEALAAAVLAATGRLAWRPIETAPQDGSELLLGLLRDGRFQRGIGRWQVNDEADQPGFWSVVDWFGAPPSHWAPLPPPPAR